MIGESWSEINCPTVHQNTLRENGVERLLSVTASVIQTASSSHPTSSSEIACLPARAAHNCLSNTFASYPSYFIVKLSLQFSIEHNLYSSSAATVGHLVVVSENKYGVALRERNHSSGAWLVTLFQWTNHVPWLFTVLVVNKFLRNSVVDSIQWYPLYYLTSDLTDFINELAKSGRIQRQFIGQIWASGSRVIVS